MIVEQRSDAGRVRYLSLWVEKFHTSAVAANEGVEFVLRPVGGFSKHSEDRGPVDGSGCSHWCRESYVPSYSAETAWPLCLSLLSVEMSGRNPGNHVIDFLKDQLDRREALALLGYNAFCEEIIYKFHVRLIDEHFFKVVFVIEVILAIKYVINACEH